MGAIRLSETCLFWHICCDHQCYMGNFELRPYLWERLKYISHLGAD